MQFCLQMQACHVTVAVQRIPFLWACGLLSHITRHLGISSRRQKLSPLLCDLQLHLRSQLPALQGGAGQRCTIHMRTPSCLCACMGIGMCICTYMCIYKPIHVHIHVHLHIHILIHVHLHMHLHLHIYMHMYIYILYINIYTCVYVYIYIPYTYILPQWGPTAATWWWLAHLKWAHRL